MKKTLSGSLVIAVVIAWNFSALSADDSTSGNSPPKETIVFIRHGEKPEKESGQLNCQGLNRALALPRMMISKFGTPNYLFAPAPARRTGPKGEEYNYIRPLATIEPTAIKLGLPVNTDYSFTDIDGLRFELTRDKYQSALIFVAWEHAELERVVKQLVAQFNGDSGMVPKWDSKDYDSIYVVQITGDGGAKSISFKQDHQGLDNLATDCPDSQKP